MTLRKSTKKCLSYITFTVKTQRYIMIHHQSYSSILFSIIIVLHCCYLQRYREYLFDQHCISGLILSFLYQIKSLNFGVIVESLPVNFSDFGFFLYLCFCACPINPFPMAMTELVAQKFHSQLIAMQPLNKQQECQITCATHTILISIYLHKAQQELRMKVY